MPRPSTAYFCATLALSCPAAHAACDLSPGAGDDTYTCDSGSASGLVDLSGNNRLVFPAGSTAVVSGPISFGDGADSALIEGGTLQGALSQGGGIDDFVMTGGTLASLAQGDGRDTFNMSGGTLLGAFEDGDVAYFSGGSIGRVDMKLDNNLFDMSGGTIIGNLVTGLGQDTILLSGGQIGGNISTSAGDDLIRISGGELRGNLLASVGNDTVQWAGGSVLGSLDLGPGDDQLTLAGLGSAALAAPPRYDGGLGSDSLVISASQPLGAARYLNFERISLQDGSLWRFDDTLTLGDSASLSGSLTIAEQSTLASAGGSVAALSGLASVVNAGTLDLSASGAHAGDTFTVLGNYQGAGGTLVLQSVLAGDGSPSDALVVSGGTLSGQTLLRVSNLGGGGAATGADGIAVVQAVNGASSSPGAFTLGAPLAAGAYQYHLFRGGVSAGSENNWYLRSSVVGPTAGEAPTVAAEGVGISAASGALIEAVPVLPSAAAGESIPLYRMEAPLYAAVPGVAQGLLRLAVGSFHERHGQPQATLRSASWGRLIGEQSRQRWAGAAQPRFAGRSSGFQVGQDVFTGTLGSGQQQAGVFAGTLRGRGAVQGFHDGWANSRAGRLSLRSDQLGAYWTWQSQQGLYVDAQLATSRFDGKARSDRGLALNLAGHGQVASVEAGVPWRLGTLQLEPQAQLIASRVALDRKADAVSTVGFAAGTAWQGRLGLRLSPAGNPSRRLQPWLRADLTHTLAGHDSVTYASSDRLSSQRRASRADLLAGATWALTAELAWVASVGYSQQLDSQPQASHWASLGVRLSW
ncbi:autotransporter outer membrane beta-barrel domain-containing protein [Pseudomonas sp. NPDC007930]|uniref:autotransporter family protein n=1 Tax=Pseudomonas sp. NPDC007930 TaxID=3364417 RepID=UPI0036EA9247